MVGADGELRLLEEERRRWGLTPGSKLLIKETPEGLLLRAADPPLTKVYVEPTSGCNLSCRTCVRNSWSEPLGAMSMATYKGLIDGLREVPSLRKISFWGFGEPLLHPDIVRMVAMASGLGIETQVITNALLLDSEMAEGLVAAGLDSLVVSIDGASPEAYTEVRTGADLGLVKRNVGLLRKARRHSPRHNPEIGIEFVVMRRNVNELRHLRRLASSLGASFIVLTNVLPYTEEMKDEILYGLSAGSFSPSHRSKWWPEVMLPRMDIRRESCEPLLALLDYSNAPNMPQPRFDGTAGYCRFVNEGSAVVAWDGGVSPCVALMHSYPCYVIGRKKEIRRFVLGNVGEERIADIWRRDEFVRFRDLVQRFDFSPCSDCGGCNLAESNEEDCFGNTFPVCGDCLWAHGVIQCP
ncbi:MAG: radical SAM protein [Chloroflexi bacterium]|nr:radical SAM protein [Chloroflexota bacterium]